MAAAQSDHHKQTQRQTESKEQLIITILGVGKWSRSMIPSTREPASCPDLTCRFIMSGSFPKISFSACATCLTASMHEVSSWHLRAHHQVHQHMCLPGSDAMCMHKRSHIIMHTYIAHKCMHTGRSTQRQAVERRRHWRRRPQTQTYPQTQTQTQTQTKTQTRRSGGVRWRRL